MKYLKLHLEYINSVLTEWFYIAYTIHNVQRPCCTFSDFPLLWPKRPKTVPVLYRHLCPSNILSPIVALRLQSKEFCLNTKGISGYGNHRVAKRFDEWPFHDVIELYWEFSCPRMTVDEWWLFILQRTSSMYNGTHHFYLKRTNVFHISDNWSMFRRTNDEFYWMQCSKHWHFLQSQLNKIFSKLQSSKSKNVIMKHNQEYSGPRFNIKMTSYQ